MNKIELLDETLKIIRDGSYSIPDKETAEPVKVHLKLNEEQIRKAVVIKETEVHELIDHPPDKKLTVNGRCGFAVSNSDSFAAAASISNEYLYEHDDPKVLVLNFASPVNPGGGVRRGAKAQEEDLCRKSTLLASLESAEARQFYTRNREKNSYLGSDSMILSPTVEIIRDEYNDLVGETSVVSVLTCAAPNLRRAMNGVNQEKLEQAVYSRIMGMLQVAVKFGYKYLVLGAWGCGAFGNDAEMIALSFRRAFKEIRCGQFRDVNTLFDRVEFAVLHNPKYSYNYDCFYKYFNNFSVTRTTR